MTAPEVPRWVHLDDEVTGVRVLLDLVDHELRLARSLDYGRHAVDALLAPAIERLCKLTYGLIIETDTGTWPGKPIVKFSHHIAELHSECVELIDSRIGHAAHADHLISAGARLASNPYATPLFAHLESYAAGARYFSLDSLGEKGPSRETLREFWAEVDNMSFERTPKPLPTDGAEMEAALRKQRADDLRDVIDTIVSYYHQAWAQGVCGPTAHQWAGRLVTSWAP
jgi:hypothetical protein